MTVQSSRSKAIREGNAFRPRAPIPKETDMNHKSTFTAREVLCFLKSKSLVKVITTVDTVTDDHIEWILKTSGFTRSRVEDRMVDAAFESLAPRLPKIPRENIVKMLEFSKANKIGAAYKITNRVSWSNLKNDLNEKRAEILRTYRTYLLSGGDVEQYAADQVRAAVHIPTTISQRMPSTRAKAPSSSEPQHLESNSECLPSTERRLSPNPISEKDEWAGHHTSDVAQTRIPCYVTTRRKKGLKRPEGQQKATGGTLMVARRLSKLQVERTGFVSHNQIIRKGRTDERVEKSNLIPDGKGGDTSACALGSPRGGRSNYGSFSSYSDMLDALQLAASPEYLCEPEGFGAVDEDDWDDGTPPEIQPSVAGDTSTSGPEESPTTRTLRKLAEWRDRVIEEKRTGVWQEKQRKWQQRDFMNSPDSDFSFSEACRSPRQIDQCMFAFRGLRIDAPAAPEKPSREFHPVWYVREDAGSPTPMGLGRHRSNVTCRRKPAS